MTKRKIVKEKVCCQVEFPKVLRLRMLTRQGILGSGYRIQASSKENDHQAKRVKEGRARSSVARVSYYKYLIDKTVSLFESFWILNIKDIEEVRERTVWIVEGPGKSWKVIP